MKIDISAKIDLDDQDLRAISKAVANAIYNAVRALVRDGYLPDASAEAATDAPDATAMATEPQTAPPPQPAQEPPQEPEPPLFGRYMEREPEPEPLAAVPKPPKKPRLSVAKIVSTVHVKPPGYITTDQATIAIGGTESDKAQLGQWIRAKQVVAVIVDDNRQTPTKGLGGRLMVERASLMRRQALRQANAKLLPKDRRPFQPERIAAE